jgi:hypothetical protein
MSLERFMAASSCGSAVAGVFGWKPNVILLSFQDWIEAQNAIITTAWPYHVHIQSARQACLRAPSDAQRSARIRGSAIAGVFGWNLT